MYLEKLSVVNFKNYADCSIEFNRRVNVFVGRNGTGKTNLLDMIHYLSMTKSAFTSSDNQCIRIGENFFVLRATFQKEGRTYELMASCQPGNRKTFRENQLDYERLSAHIGKYPVVLVAPDDADLVRDSSEIRRKFFDSLISQCDAGYLDALIVYNQALKQRNGLLRLFQESGRTDHIALESYDRLLIKHGTTVFGKRNDFLRQFVPIFQKYYQILVDGTEVAAIEYLSGVSEMSFEEGLKRNLQRDLILQRSNFGIHRDDFMLTLSGEELRKFGSQGQQKSFVIALKLAQFDILQSIKGFAPLLLLDDIFDKLDDLRIARLLEIIRNGPGQLFITDARPDRTFELLSKIGVNANVYDVDGGMIRNMKSSG